MKKLIVEEWVSLDGYVSDKEGNLSFFSNLVGKTYTDDYQLNFLKTIDTILLGRKTYEQFVLTWPQKPADYNTLAFTMNKAKKIVFSNTLNDAPWGKWEKAEIKSGNAVSTIKEIKSLQGKNIVLWGSISLAHILMKENLVDEYHIHLCPTLTGGGRKFFPDEINPTTLKLVETKQFKTGTVFLNYQSESV